MSNPSTDLDPRTIDEHIEQILHTSLEQHEDLHSRCIRDLAYLYGKENILVRVRQRLMLADPSEPATDLSGGTAVGWQQHTMRSQPRRPLRRTPLAWPKMAAVLAAALLLISALLGATYLLHQRSQSVPALSHPGHTQTAVSPRRTPGNVLLFPDSLSHNIHSWPTGKIEQNLFFFANGAYHITNQSMGAALVVAPDQTFASPFSSILTMTQMQGNLISAFNAFGMVLDYAASMLNHRLVQRFYTFEITIALEPPASSKLYFFAYDSSRQIPWTNCWSAPLPRAFHSGLKTANTLQVTQTRNTLTFIVNNQLVGSIPLARLPFILTGGQMGMAVFLPGTDGAFSHMLVTRL